MSAVNSLSNVVNNEVFKKVFKIKDLEELQKLSSSLSGQIFNSSYEIFYLYGDLGAGKTQLISLLLQDRIKGLVNSPTFNILNIYEGLNGEKYLHFDLYRKSAVSMADLMEIGLETLYENPNNRCFIEWPERISDLQDSKINMNNSLDIIISKEDINPSYRSITIDKLRTI